MSGSFVPSYLANAYLTGAMPSQQPVVMPNTGFLQTLLGGPTASPLESRETANRSALDVLTNLAGGNTTTEGEAPPSGRGTGNPLTDIPQALTAFSGFLGVPEAMQNPVTGALAALNALGPTGIMGTALNTMIGQAPSIYGSVPAKTNITGIPAAFHGLRQVARDIYNDVTGYPSKDYEASMEGGAKGPGQPDALSAEEAAAQAAAAAATGDMGGSKDDGGGKSSPEGGFGDATAESSPGSSEGGDKARRGGLATDNGFLGPEKFAQGGAVVELQGGGKIAVGPGGGLDDLIPTSINGKRAAALSDGEFVIPADVVSMMGDGSSNAGARRLYDLVRQIRQSKTGTSRQAGPLPVGEILKRTMR